MPDAPAPLITLDEVKAHLSLEPGETEQDDLIQGYLDAALGSIDGPAGWLGRSITRQEHVLYLDRFDASMIRLPFPPVLSVESVETRAAGGTWTALDGADWEFVSDLLMPVPGKSWPFPGALQRGVRISYTAGYDVIPPAIRAAVLMMTADLWKHRGTVVVGTNVTAAPMSATVESLLQPFRVFAL